MLMTELLQKRLLTCVLSTMLATLNAHGFVNIKLIGNKSFRRKIKQAI